MAESKIQNFNHLKIHSQYSICEGAIKIDELKDFCKDNIYNIHEMLKCHIYVELYRSSIECL